MTTELTVRAPAKINLYLAVTGKEDNGYHTVETVMQAISLYDCVNITRADDGDAPIILTCDVPAVPCGEDNLAWRAAEVFFAESGMRFPVRIHIKKHIPIAGGLAGGSTDAAAVLCALNRLAGEPLSRETLLSAGAKLGMDVPFCVLSCLGVTAALGLHYGEIMFPCKPLVGMTVVVASSGESVSTPWAYKRMDAVPLAAPGYAPLLGALDAGDTDGVLSSMYNAFEEVILPLCPSAAQCREILLSSRADAVMMSGSGPTVIALYHEENAAHIAAQELQKAGFSAAVCETI